MPGPRRLTVDPLLDEYIDCRIATGELVRSSAVTIRALLHQWYRFAGPLVEWTPDSAARWVHDSQIRPNSRKSRLSRLRPYVAWLVEHGHLERDITTRVAKVKAPPPTPRDIQTADVGRLLASAPDARAELVVLLMVHCALRCVDLSRVRVEDIDVRRRLLAVRAKGGRNEVTHTVPIPDEAWSALIRYIEQQGRSSGPLITSSRRTEPTALSANRLSVLLRQWIKDAGLKVFPYDGTSAHALRHTCAQNMIDSGADIREVQYALGHRHATTTEIYLRREPPGLRDAMNGRSYVLPTSERD